MGTSEDRIIDRFHEAAREAGLEYFIIGGFAASYWGTPRFTADVDYVVSGTQFELAKSVLSSLGYTLQFAHPKGSFAHFSSFQESEFRVDLMIVDEQTWAKLRAKGELGNFGGKELYPVVAPLHLIAMKLHAASQIDRAEFQKDLSDIVAIMLQQKISLEDLDSAGILTKYGNVRNISEIKQRLGYK